MRVMSEIKDGMFSERLRVLVVDDEPAICRVLTIALTRAVARLRGHHVVFEIAAATHPHLRHQTLFMTGDISERADKLILSCKCPSVRKPFELKELIGVV